MHVSATHSWKNQGGRRGVLVFEGGVIAPPCQGIRSTLLPPASLPAAVRLNDLRIVPSGANQAEFRALFPRNVERDLVADENRRDLNRFPLGGRCQGAGHRTGKDQVDCGCYGGYSNGAHTARHQPDKTIPVAH
jgi:hypothetical protein